MVLRNCLLPFNQMSFTVKKKRLQNYTNGRKIPIARGTPVTMATLYIFFSSTCVNYITFASR